MTDAKALVERLRQYAADYTNTFFHDELIVGAADMIEQQAAEIAALRAACVCARDGYIGMRATGLPCLPEFTEHRIAQLDAALAARSNPPESPDSSRG